MQICSKNLMLSNSIGAVISYGNNEDNLNRTASLFKRMMTTTLIMIVILFAEDLRVRCINLKMMISLYMIYKVLKSTQKMQ